MLYVFIFFIIHFSLFIFVVMNDEYWMAKALELARLLIQIPVDPTQWAILAVGVIVSSLRAAEFVSAQQHRHATRYE
jgi:hypothetical protein